MAAARDGYLIHLCNNKVSELVKKHDYTKHQYNQNNVHTISFYIETLSTELSFNIVIYPAFRLQNLFKCRIRNGLMLPHTGFNYIIDL